MLSTNEDADINSSSNTFSAEVKGFYDEAEESQGYDNPDDPEITNPRSLSFDEAARCLSLLGKNDSGLRYSFLMLTASDKLLTDISIIPTFRNLLFVDVSGNLLTLSEIQILTAMTYLLMIKADRNRIESANFQSNMLYLQVLSLNRNKIRETKGISHRLLECLELSNNSIKAVDLNPYELENLKVLEIRGNILTTMNGLLFRNLRALYIAENRIERIEGLETLLNLETLHARGNFISSFDALYKTSNICPKLSYLNLRENKISRISEFRKLQQLKKLEILVTSQNPFEKNYAVDNSYRINLLAIFPGLKRINKDPVLAEELVEADRIKKQKFPDENISDADEVIEQPEPNATP
ncbi:leucine-rich repeat-containing protein 23-like [Athalia rosae]|uniref:leucine-rich repeat-containing protein 23-like n=1 Tax=Athalia rosae TaxID=37344 RepID=UPI0020345F33|nr:leucine-rich repeat-containing protein 23-like [Athalia rosae]